MVERRSRAYRRQHAPDTGRAVTVFHIQISVGWELAAVTMGAKIIGSSQFDFSQGGEEPSRAQFPVARLVAARTSNLTLIGGWFGELQQLGKRRRSGLLHGRAQSRLDRFQIGAATTVAFGEDASQQSG